MIDIPDGVGAIPVFMMVCLLGLTLLAGMLVNLNRLTKKHSLLIHAVEKKINVVNRASLGMGQRMLDLESQIMTLRQRHNDFQEDDLNFSYHQAHTLIEQGLSCDAVAANSGLSLSEVNLMELLHKETTKHSHLADAV